MEFPQHAMHSQDQDTAEVSTHAGPSVSLCARLWEYRGPQEKLVEFDWGSDEAIATLVRDVLGHGQGKIAELRGNTLVSQFDNAFNALTAAKSLQVRLLTLHRAPQASQMVAAIMVSGNDAGASAKHSDPLVEANCAQILVSAPIHEAAKTVPGFQFGPKPAREAADNAEALYELLWTDESTYSHVRKAGQPDTAAVAGTKRYEIESELGRGAMGVVYKAIDKVIGRTVALKTISIQRNFADRDELVQRLKLEAKAAGSLDHPNIITIYDIGQDEEFVYLSMQFVEGKTLAKILEEGKLPPLSTLLSYVDQICSGVGFAHQRGVIHRDLKPANFMITADHTVKVLDFGIAKLGDATVTQTGVVVGTATYMSPEQATGKKLDQRSDIFALGTVFYELFTRERPFKGDIAAILYKLIHEDPTPPSIINPSLPAGIDRIIRKALAKNPKDRYQSCEEMRDAFREQTALLQSAAVMQSAVPQPAGATSAQSRPPSSTRNQIVATRKRSGGSGWAGVLTIMLLAAGATGLWAYRVKSQTGSFPAVVQKALSALRQDRTRLVAVDSSNAATPASQPAGESATASTSTTPASTQAPANADGASVPASTSLTPAPGQTTSDDAAAQSSSTLSPTVAQPATAPNSAAKTDTTPSVPAANPTQVTQPALADNADKSQPAASGDDQEHITPAESKVAKAKRIPAKAVQENVRVEGFSRADVPDLLRKADAASGAGDYSLALYEYNLVLRLDHHNAAARAGVARATAAKQERVR